MALVDPAHHRLTTRTAIAERDARHREASIGSFDAKAIDYKWWWFICLCLHRSWSARGVTRAVWTVAGGSFPACLDVDGRSIGQ